MLTEMIPLTTFSGMLIHADEDQMVSLNDLWKAGGSPVNRDPRHWLILPETKRFLAFQCRKHDVRKSDIVRSSKGGKGGGGGTWAHWRVALDYAAYLSEPLKDHIYEVFRERIEEEADPELGLQRWQERAERRYERVGQGRPWIVARLRSILTRKLETDSLKEHGITDPRDYARLTNETYIGLLGRSARALKDERGLAHCDNLRDHLNELQLAGLVLAETLARHNIERDSRWGYRACAQVCRSSAERVKEAVDKDLAG